MGRRLGSILLGWASTLKCCSMLLWLDLSASSMDWRHMMMLSGRERERGNYDIIIMLQQSKQKY